MNIEIGDIPTYDVPEGSYRAKITEVVDLIPPKQGHNKTARVKMDVVYPEKPGWIYQLGKNYCADAGKNTELIEDAKTILGDDLLKGVDANRRLSLDGLVGKEVDITVVHIQGPNYHKPFVKLSGIYPPGTLDLRNHL